MRFQSLILCGILLLLGACSGNQIPKPGEQVLRLNIHTEPPTLDPRKATDVVSIFVIKQCQEGLMQRGHDGKPCPGLAERYEVSEDGLIYTFYLRDAKWSNGNPLTAQDFERSWKTLLDPNFPSEQAFELYLLKHGKAAREGKIGLDAVGVKALDERTLRIELEHPAPYFLSVITIHPFFPIPEPFDPRISSGAFCLNAWKALDELILEKNPSYWDAQRVKLNRVHLYMVADDQTEFQLFEKGELDWAGHPFSNLPSEALPSLQSQNVIETLPLDATYHYSFNTKIFPFHNVTFRRALSLAIRRQEIVTNITQSGQVPTASLVPEGMWGRTEGLPYFTEDIEQAKLLFNQALEELGTTVDKLPPITLSYNTMVSHHKIAQAIQQQWMEAFGLKVELQNKEWKVFLDDVGHGRFDVARGGSSANIDDPITFLETFMYPTSNRNASSWSHPEYTRLIHQAERTADPQTRLNILREAERLLISEMPIAPIYTYRASFVRKPYVRNVYLSELGDMDIKYAFIAYD